MGTKALHCPSYSLSGRPLPKASPDQRPPVSIAQSWQQVHQQLACILQTVNPMPDVIGLAAYHFCVYKAFGQAYASAAHAAINQLLVHLPQMPVVGWSAAQLNQLCTTAWLSAQSDQSGLHGAAHAQALLAGLDEPLLREGRRLLLLPDAPSRSNFFRVLRYFGLRGQQLPASSYLRQLLALPRPAVPGLGQVLPTTEPPYALGLSSGLTAELLVLINLHNAGFSVPDIQQQVRTGVQHLLAARRDVDFSEHKYSVFPYQLAAHSREASFSSELSWQRGDLGPALLLYRAHELLQDAELAKIAELVGLNTLLRTTTHSTEVSTAPFLKGAAGVAHLYRKLYQLSGQPAYGQGYRFWLGQTQHWLSQELATGYYQHREADLLHGLAGVGLVLLSALTPTELDWDAVVL